mmetsp:Transcript_8408/g.16756  ORF Transcript_8408/g.16756 Transcript_8408/m.16756 type:complete len:96 (-) Transcript_8408:473-760(-)
MNRCDYCSFLIFIHIHPQPQSFLLPPPSFLPPPLSSPPTLPTSPPPLAFNLASARNSCCNAIAKNPANRTRSSNLSVSSLDQMGIFDVRLVFVSL